MTELPIIITFIPVSISETEFILNRIEETLYRLLGCIYHIYMYTFHLGLMLPSDAGNRNIHVLLFICTTITSSSETLLQCIR